MRWTMRAGCWLFTGLLSAACLGSAAAQRVFVVTCGVSASAPSIPNAITLHSIAEVNALTLAPQDRVLFARGAVCSGELHPRGSGFSLEAIGEGPLPRIDASAQDEAALSLFNVDHVRIDSLDLRGGTTYGVHVSGDKPEMHGITLHNLTVSAVHGKLTKKGSGLVVIAPADAHARFFDVNVDGVRAFDTTQWSGIFIDGATHASVRNSIVHDVQGDGIVLFESEDGLIAHSVAWHTGMQLTQSIGTPNAIWTWRCNRCLVEDNEAFLTDSPGIDGGAFDIDWGNTSNTVSENFGHDTQGYCVSVFAAFGPTLHSRVEANLCLNNGRSPRLAQQQGAVFLLSWNGGSIEDVVIAKNRIDWQPDGDAPAMQSSPETVMSGLRLEGNTVSTSGPAAVSSTLRCSGSRNVWRTTGSGHIDSTTSACGWTLEHAAEDSAHLQQESTAGWRLAIHADDAILLDEQVLEQLLVRLTTASEEYALTLRTDGAPFAQRLRDYGLTGTLPILDESSTRGPALVQLIAPDGRIVESWKSVPAAIPFGLALRHRLGKPRYSSLPFGSAQDSK